MKHIQWFVLLVAMVGLLAACGGGGGSSNENQAAAISGDVIAGEQAYIASCSSCHGFDAKGLPGLGKDMTTSTYIDGMTEEQFVAFVKAGRSISDPANTTGVDMPPKGGNPALSDADIINIRAYIFSLK